MDSAYQDPGLKFGSLRRGVGGGEEGGWGRSNVKKEEEKKKIRR